MRGKPLFAIMPYLKTSGPLAIRGIMFRSSTDYSGLASHVQEELVALLQLFYLRDDLQLLRMTYACLENTDDRAKAVQFVQGAYQAQTLISYLYGSPHPTTGEPFLTFEHSGIYLLQSDSVYVSSTELDHNLVRRNTPFGTSASPAPNMESQVSSNLPLRGIAGYTGTLNGTSFVSIAQGQRLYPPPPHFWLNLSQDLVRDVGRLHNEASLWALHDLFFGQQEQLSTVEDRVLTALEWHNRSMTLDVSEDTALISLAIAFECLLGLESGEQLSSRFKETILTLLGPIPRLDSWLDQFYKARSKLVHEGSWPHLMFIAVDKERVAKVLSGKEDALAYRSLTSYGRSIFRLCVSAVLSGAKLAEKANLAALFVHNQQRLEDMCEQLARTERTPDERMRAVAPRVYELNEYAFAGANVKIETVIGTERRLLQTYLDTKPQLPQGAADLVHNVQLEPTAVAAASDYTDQLLRAFQAWSGSLQAGTTNNQDEHSHTVQAFLQYAAKPFLDWQIRNFRANAPKAAQAMPAEAPTERADQADACDAEGQVSETTNTPKANHEDSFSSDESVSESTDPEIPNHQQTDQPPSKTET